MGGMQERKLESNGNKRKRNPGSMTTTVQHLSCFSTSSCPIIHHNKLHIYIHRFCIYTWVDCTVKSFCTCIVAHVCRAVLPRIPQISIFYNLSPLANKVLLHGGSTVLHKWHHKRIPSPHLSYPGLSTSACSVKTEVACQQG